MKWTRLADLPDPAGLKGMHGGVSHGRLILAGGSNFPIPNTEGGKKTFHAAIYTQPLSEGGMTPWIRDEQSLPAGLAEGACVTTPDGVAALGGFAKSGPVATAFLMQWDAVSGRAVFRDLPDLPSARAYAAAAWLDGRLYVAGGQNSAGGMQEFLVLDLQSKTPHWETLPSWPGPRRFGAVLAVLTFSNVGVASATIREDREVRIAAEAAPYISF
ncbi:MAG: hypothetical protein ACREIA_07155 [Opitutaceae bacterium]